MNRNGLADVWNHKQAHCRRCSSQRKPSLEKADESLPTGTNDFETAAMWLTEYGFP
jgi:hypothetical protein